MTDQPQGHGQPPQWGGPPQGPQWGPPNGPQGGPPQGPPPQLPPRKGFLARHKFLTFLGALIVVVIAIVVVNSGSSSSGGGSATAGGSGATTSQKSAAGIGAPVRDGKFEFVVTAVDPGKSTIGTAPLDRTAQGQFVLVHISVRNIGSKQQMFDQSSQKMIDQQGRQLSPDTTSGIYVDPNNFLAQINPGNSVQGVLVFDIPKDATPTKLELHDSPFSGGVTVQLN